MSQKVEQTGRVAKVIGQYHQLAVCDVAVYTEPHPYAAAVSLTLTASREPDPWIRSIAREKRAIPDHVRHL